jgi:hypothetical protein
LYFKRQRQLNPSLGFLRREKSKLSKNFHNKGNHLEMAETIQSQTLVNNYNQKQNHNQGESVGSFSYQVVNQNSTYQSEPKLFIADTHPDDKYHHVHSRDNSSVISTSE